MDITLFNSVRNRCNRSTLNLQITADNFDEITIMENAITKGIQEVNDNLKPVKMDDNVKISKLVFKLYDSVGTLVGYESWEPNQGWCYSKTYLSWDKKYIPHTCKEKYFIMESKENESEI